MVTLFVHVARLADLAFAPATPGGDRPAELLRRFRELIAAHCREHEPVAFYAKRPGHASAQLARVCREALGHSPTALINGHLIREAQRAPVYSAPSIKQIAHAVASKIARISAAFFASRQG